MRLLIRIFFLLFFGAFVPLNLVAQENKTQAGTMTLEQCVAYALKNRPAVQQAYIDEEITERDIKVALSDWFPQLNVNGNVQHYLKMPVTIFPNEAGLLVPRQIGTANTSNLSLVGEQAIFDQDVIFATRGSRFARLRSDQVTTNEKINTIVTVSQAFYDLLLTQEQLKILDQDIIRQQRQLKDAFAQYEQGLVDKTDYKRAEISLGNVRNTRKRFTNRLRLSMFF
jgi:outer membrane protein TolC